MANEYGAFQDATGRDSELVLRGCCIRFGSSKADLGIHSNSTHISTGVHSVGVNSNGDLEFHLDAGLPIVAAGAFPDETLASRGIQAGVSGGVGKSYARFFKATVVGGQVSWSRLNLNIAGHYANVAGVYSNVWLLFASVRKRTAGGPSLEDRVSALEAALADFHAG